MGREIEGKGERKKEKTNVSPKESGKREAYRTVPDSDMGRVQQGFDRSRTEPRNVALMSTPNFHNALRLSSGL